MVSMQPRLLKRISWALILIIAFSAIILPNVRAQTTSIKIVVSAPSQVQLMSDGTAHFDVITQVNLKIPQSTFVNNQPSFELLIVAMILIEASQTNLSASAVSKPDPCVSSSTEQNGQKAYAVCSILPVCQFTSSCSESNAVTFHATLSNAQAQQYHFRVIAFFVPQTPQDYTITTSFQLGAPNAGPQGSGWDKTDFYVELANTPILQYTTQATTTLLQIPQPVVASNPDNSALVSVGLVSLIVVVVAVLICNERRTRQKPSGTQMITQEPKVEEPKTEKPTTLKRFCIECGKELELGSKICNNCGTKQP